MTQKNNKILGTIAVFIILFLIIVNSVLFNMLIVEQTLNDKKVIRTVCDNIEIDDKTPITMNNKTVFMINNINYNDTFTIDK